MSEADDEQFLPCPFCGGTEIRLLMHSGGWQSVDCISCGATKREVTNHRETMVAAWNQRSDDHRRLTKAELAVKATRRFLNWLVSGPGPNAPGIEALADMRRNVEAFEKV